MNLVTKLLASRAWPRAALGVAFVLTAAICILRPSWIYRIRYSAEIAEIERVRPLVASGLATQPCSAARPNIEAGFANDRMYLQCEDGGYRIGLDIGFDDAIYLRLHADGVCWSFDPCNPTKQPVSVW